jgi:hypothetical protein
MCVVGIRRWIVVKITLEDIDQIHFLASLLLKILYDYRIRVERLLCGSTPIDRWLVAVAGLS